MGMAGFEVALMVITMTMFPCVYGKEYSDQQEIKVQRLLKQLNKPAIKSIKSEDGDIIDCVPITKQPAFDNPLLKNHKSQMRPSFIPEGNSTNTKIETYAITQVWHKNGECPNNTVPIRRTKKEHILRAKSIEGFGKKTHENGPGGNHEYALMNSKKGNYYGTTFIMNIWRPEVEVPNEFSLSQTWLWSGDSYNLNTIEAGLQVYPRIYGDNNLRLFVYWTSDGYRNTGCYNIECSGFVQISKSVTVGVSYVNDVSQYNGDQYILRMTIWKDGENWWLRICDENVGYWPDSLFTSLKDSAEKVQWGGEIVNSKTDGRHTATDMGSGHFAEEGFKKASYFRSLMTVDGDEILVEPQDLYPYAGNSYCYNIKHGNSGTDWGIYFFYGGPGQCFFLFLISISNCF